MATKKCTTCKKLKSLAEFWKDKNKPFGVASLCKECATIGLKKYRSTRKYKEKNRVARRTIDARWKEKYKEKIAKWKEENKDKLADLQVKWREKNKDKVKELQQSWHDKNTNAKVAYYELQKMIEGGDISPPHLLKCEDCKEFADIYHHHGGYDYGVDVIPLCRSCLGKRKKTPRRYMVQSD